MRRGEILGAKWADVDVEKRLLRIARSLSQVDNTTMEKSPKTRSGRRTIKLMTNTADLLKRIKALQAQNKLFLGDGYLDSDYIFAEANGEPLKPKNLTHSFMHYRDEAKLDITYHDLRHTHASWLLAAGVHPKTVSERLGHSSVQITLDLYSHLLPHIQDEAINKLEKTLGIAREVDDDIPDIA